MRKQLNAAFDRADKALVNLVNKQMQDAKLDWMALRRAAGLKL